MNSANGSQSADVGPLGAVQAFGVMLGGPVALTVLAGVSVLKSLRRVLRGRPPGPLAALGTAALLAYARRGAAKAPQLGRKTA